MRIEKIGVVITDKKGNVIKEFESVLQAAKYVNTSSSNISKCCSNNKRKIKSMRKGYYFRYK